MLISFSCQDSLQFKSVLIVQLFSILMTKVKQVDSFQDVLVRPLKTDFNLAVLHSSQKLNRFINNFLIIFLKERANTSAPPFRNLVFSSVFTVIKVKQLFLISSSDRFDNSKSLDALHKVVPQQFLSSQHQIICNKDLHSSVFKQLR